MLFVWLFALLVLIAFGVLIAERRVRRMANARTISALQPALGDDVQVDLHGEPLLLHLYRRSLPGVTIRAQHVPVLDGRARVAGLRVELEDLSFPKDAPLTAGSGRFTARIAEADLLALVQLPVGLRPLRITEQGLRLVTAAGIRLDLQVRVRDGGALLFRPNNELLRLLPISDIVVRPSLPAGATIERVRIRGSDVIVSGPLDGQRLVSN